MADEKCPIAILCARVAVAIDEWRSGSIRGGNKTRVTVVMIKQNRKKIVIFVHNNLSIIEDSK